MEPMHKINKVEVRNLQIEDYAQLSQSFKRVYADKLFSGHMHKLKR